ncbi:MAG: antitoxin [Candidatus Acididesulfobacter diazotrophicus]|jgi:antitoxin VapB|uniref:Antitoxin n=1 Tax=Candidatus Acididesulfobacter diazotrophicus TaxID=2597226 RepID=A0A519BL36_9DELT|nr:MAG: antitoxin [Candidatus Acididesulfobacter diazotrophicus]
MKTAKLFQNGKSQAVRLLKEFRFETSEVYIKKVGRSVILTPKDDYWDSLFESVDKFSKDFMVERNQPEMQKRVAL